MEKIRWIAVGDSFTYLNDNLEETKFRVQRGYLDRTLDHLKGKLDCELINIGINGSTTMSWLGANMPKADLYTILLGTNDWFAGIPLGTEEDFKAMVPNSILGNLSILIHRMQKQSRDAKIIVMNPVERGDFVYLFDPNNNAPNSTNPVNAVMLSEVADAIIRTCENAKIDCADLHKLSGFTQENAVHYKHVKTENGYQNLPWPDYTKYPVSPDDEYPYPEDAAWMTFDGLHPTDLGNEIIAGILSKKILEVFGIQ